MDLCPVRQESISGMYEMQWRHYTSGIMAKEQSAQSTTREWILLIYWPCIYNTLSTWDFYVCPPSLPLQRCQPPKFKMREILGGLALLSCRLLKCSHRLPSYLLCCLLTYYNADDFCKMWENGRSSENASLPQNARELASLPLSHFCSQVPDEPRGGYSL